MSHHALGLSGGQWAEPLVQESFSNTVKSFHSKHVLQCRYVINNIDLFYKFSFTFVPDSVKKDVKPLSKHHEGKQKKKSFKHLKKYKIVTGKSGLKVSVSYNS